MRSCIALLVTSVLLAAATLADAQVTVLGQYRLGEDDAGAIVGGAGNTTTTDIAGVADNLTKAGAPVYAANSVAGIGSLSMNFNGGGDIYSRPAFLTGTDNFVIQGWVTRDAGTNGVVINNGDAGFRGAGLIFHDAGAHVGHQTWMGLYGGNAFLDTLVPALVGVPTHMAVVRNSGTTTVYVNGVAEFTSGGGPNAPIAADSFRIGGVNGRADQVSIGTITGTFTPATHLDFPFHNSANLTQLYNNGFEAGDVGEFSSTGNGGVAPAAAYGITTTEGTQMFAYNGGGATPNAVVTSSIIEGQAGAPTYLYFDYGNFGQNQPQQMLVEILNAADNSVLFSQTINDGLGTNNVSLFSPFFLNFIPTVSDFRVRFTDQNIGDVSSSDGLLDNVRVSQLQAVPEPASVVVWSLMGLLLVGVAGRGWRRR